MSLFACLFYVYKSFACMYMSVPLVCLVLTETRKEHQSSRTGITKQLWVDMWVLGIEPMTFWKSSHFLTTDHVSSPRHFLLNKIPFRESSLLNCLLKTRSVAQQFLFRVKLRVQVHPHPQLLSSKVLSKAGSLVALEECHSPRLYVGSFWLDGACIKC